MIKPELKRLLKEHKDLIKERMDKIDKELKDYENVYDLEFKGDIEQKLQELAITLLEKQGFPFASIGYHINLITTMKIII